MSAERKELFDTILKKLRMPLGDYASAAAAFATDAVLAAGYRKPQVITTIEELLELEEGTAIRDDVDEVLFLQGREDYLDWHDQWGNCCHVNLPATVLYVPGEQS